jgi:hypothetical protein
VKTRDWEHIVRAAARLGCVVARESDTHVYLVRGAIRMFAVRKFLVSAKVQRTLLDALEFSEAEWAEALRNSDS